ncbi:hypothetical protein [Aurantibacter sp.]|uniref:hypothetical protein n=1 Tax=Aurantibacter sp. TaxID=2807103 RepID=UPI0035C7E8CC
MIKYINIFFITLSLSACSSKVEKQTDKVIGTYSKLEKDNIDMFFPSEFKQISHQEYVNSIKNNPGILNKEERIKIANIQKISTGNIYHFINKEELIEVDIKMSPYFDFNKTDSTHLLAMLSANCQNSTNPFGKNCKKISAGFSLNAQTKVFKALFKVTYGSTVTYNNMYLISSNNKTFSVIIKSPKNTNYNSYIQKIRIK